MIFIKKKLSLQYQRWLYPVDKNRLDDGSGQITTTKTESSDDTLAVKKNE